MSLREPFRTFAHALNFIRPRISKGESTGTTVHQSTEPTVGGVVQAQQRPRRGRPNHQRRATLTHVPSLSGESVPATEEKAILCNRSTRPTSRRRLSETYGSRRRSRRSTLTHVPVLTDLDHNRPRFDEVEGLELPLQQEIELPGLGRTSSSGGATFASARASTQILRDSDAMSIQSSPHPRRTRTTATDLSRKETSEDATTFKAMSRELSPAHRTKSPSRSSNSLSKQLGQLEKRHQRRSTLSLVESTHLPSSPARKGRRLSLANAKVARDARTVTSASKSVRSAASICTRGRSVQHRSHDVRGTNHVPRGASRSPQRSHRSHRLTRQTTRSVTSNSSISESQHCRPSRSSKGYVGDILHHSDGTEGTLWAQYRIAQLSELQLEEHTQTQPGLKHSDKPVLSLHANAEPLDNTTLVSAPGSCNCTKFGIDSFREPEYDAVKRNEINLASLAESMFLAKPKAKLKGCDAACDPTSEHEEVTVSLTKIHHRLHRQPTSRYPPAKHETSHEAASRGSTLSQSKRHSSPTRSRHDKEPRECGNNESSLSSTPRKRSISPAKRHRSPNKISSRLPSDSPASFKSRDARTVSTMEETAGGSCDSVFSSRGESVHLDLEDTMFGDSYLSSRRNAARLPGNSLSGRSSSPSSASRSSFRVLPVSQLLEQSCSSLLTTSPSAKTSGCGLSPIECELEREDVFRYSDHSLQ